jgi:6,7-dimethyl-8-ribityllumazine synthase
MTFMSSRNSSVSIQTALPGASGMRISLVVSQWHNEITNELFTAAAQTLREAGCHDSDISRHDVPGSFELPLGAKWVLDALTPDAVICIGCIVQGETPHFRFIADAVAHSIMQLQISYTVPVIFCVLTTDTIKQAQDRAGGSHGNKGAEAAEAAIRMAALRRAL